MNTKIRKSKEKFLTISKEKLEYLEKISKEMDEGDFYGPFYDVESLIKHLGI